MEHAWAGVSQTVDRRADALLKMLGVDYYRRITGGPSVGGYALMDGDANLFLKVPEQLMATRPLSKRKLNAIHDQV